MVVTVEAPPDGERRHDAERRAGTARARARARHRRSVAPCGRIPTTDLWHVCACTESARPTTASKCAWFRCKRACFVSSDAPYHVTSRVSRSARRGSGKRDAVGRLVVVLGEARRACGDTVRSEPDECAERGEDADGAKSVHALSAISLFSQNLAAGQWSCLHVLALALHGSLRAAATAKLRPKQPKQSCPGTQVHSSLHLSTTIDHATGGPTGRCTEEKSTVLRAPSCVIPFCTSGRVVARPGRLPFVAATAR